MEKEAEDRECAICKDDMHTLAFSVLDLDLPSTVHRLSCHHAFHSSCLLTFFRSNSKTACPLCRNGSQEQYTIVTRGNNFTFTVAENEEEEEDPWVAMGVALRPYRSSSPVRSARKQLKVLTANYNTLKSQLRKEKKQCIQKALHKFRAQFRERYRETQARVKEAAQKVFVLEKERFIHDKGNDIYYAQGWNDIHQLLGKGAGFKEEYLESRKNDPWNSSFWYA
jgi:hypothetical protein